MGRRIKHFCLALIICLTINTVSRAQAPTITSAALPIAGATYNYLNDTNHVDLPTFTVTAGSSISQNWDYSPNFVTTYSASNSYTACSSGSCYGGIGPSCSGTLMSYQAGNIYTFYNIDAAGMALSGYNEPDAVGGTATGRYIPNKTLIPTPFTYGNIHTETFKYNFYENIYCGPCVAFHVVQHSTQIFTADAFGTLTTPAGTYSNTLRIKIYELNIDTSHNSSYNSQGTQNYNYQYSKDSSVSYVWLQNNTNYKLLEINMNGAGTIVKNAYYEQSVSYVGLKNYISPFSDISLFPNPNNGTFVIETGTQEKTFLKIFDLIGKEVMYEDLDVKTGKVSVNTNYLPEGIYNVQVSNSEGSINKKLVIVK